MLCISDIDYTYLDKVQGNDHHRRCIDGRITGRGNCVGYCNYSKHPGFLTAGHCKEHHCAEKGCHYFLPKPKQEKAVAKRHDAGQEIVTIAAEVISAFEGMKIMRADKADCGWRLKYITISDAYPIGMIAEIISEAVGETVVMIQLDYDFELAAQLIICKLRRIIMFDGLFGGMFDFNGDGHTNFSEEVLGFAVMEEMMNEEDGKDDDDSDFDSEDEW